MLIVLKHVQHWLMTDYACLTDVGHADAYQHLAMLLETMTHLTTSDAEM